MRKYLKSGILIVILSLFVSFTTVHKFYLSVTEVTHSEKDQSVQILSRIFIDDIEEVLEERYDVSLNLTTSDELENANQYIEKYLKSRIILTMNGEKIPFTFLGKEYDNDIMKCYIEIKNIDLKAIKSLEIQNKVLFDLFEEQQNIVHFKFDNLKKSFILIKENDKGVLNF